MSTRNILTTCLITTACAVLLFPLSSYGGSSSSSTWEGDVNNLWSVLGNWSAGVPGSSTEAILPSTATLFNLDLGGSTQNVGTVTFSGATPYTIFNGTINDRADGIQVVEANVTHVMSNDLTRTFGGSLNVNVGANATLEMAGTITGAFGVNKNGVGTLVLSNPNGNSYSGNTIVNAGTLRIINTNGSAIGTGSVTVKSGATLTGIGTISLLSTATIESGATLEPGLSPGILFVHGLDLRTGSTTRVELGGLTPGTGHDQLDVSTAELAGTLDLKYTNGFTAARGDSFTIMDAVEITNTFDAVNYPDSDPTWEISYVSNQVVVGKTGPETLLLRWSLEEGVGTNTEEVISGVSNVAQLVNGPTWTNGLAPGSSNAVNFLDTTPDSYIDAGTLSSDGFYIPTSTATNGFVASDAWTITAWVNVPDANFGSSDRCIITTDTAGGQNWWLFFLRGVNGLNNNLGFDFTNTRIRSDLDVPAGRPVFVSISGDNSATHFGLGSKHRFAVLDGTSFQTSEGSQFSNLRLDGLEIGSFNNGTREFQGDLDEVRIYDRALSEEELFSLAAANGIGGDLGAVVGADTNSITATNIEFQIRFTEDVQFFDAADINITGSLTSGIPVITGTGSVYTASIPVSGEGTIIVDLIPGSGLQTLAGDPLVFHTPSVEILFDVTSPFVLSITADSTGPVTNKAGFSIIFSEPVVGFVSGIVLDITSNNMDFVSSIQSVASTSPSGYTFSVRVGVADGASAGTFALFLSTTNILDLSGNPLAAPIPTSEVVLVSASFYQLWAVNHGLAVTNYSLLVDSDQDGRSNGREFFHDGDPVTAFDAIKRAIHVTEVGGSNYFVLTIAVPEDAVYSGGGAGGSLDTEYATSPDFFIYEEILPLVSLVPFDAGGLFMIEDPSVTLPPGLPALSPGYSYRHFRLSSPIDHLPVGYIKTDTIPFEDD